MKTPSGKTIRDSLGEAGFQEVRTETGMEFVKPVKDPEMVFQAAFSTRALKLKQAGFSAVCALCWHMHRADSVGRDQCGQDCGSPLYGKDFPEYDGPVARSALCKACFVCGQPATAGAMRPGWRGMVGVCSAHSEMIAGEHRPAKTIGGIG